jgi:ribosomal-protein-alanine N-acetyltransferase
MLECRVDNARAQKLYERFGFEAIGFRRGYYQPGNVDAVVMRLPDPAAAVPSGQQPEPAPDTEPEPDPGPVSGPVQGTDLHG